MDLPTIYFVVLKIDGNGAYHPESFLIEEKTNASILFRMSNWVSTVLSVALVITWTFGLLGKYAVLLSILQTGLGVIPVNLLIFTDQMVNLIHRSLTICGCALVLLTKRPLVSYFGKGFCTVFTLVPVFGTCHSIFGSYGTTYYRVVVIRKAMKLTHVSVRRFWPLAIAILLWSLTVSLITSIVFATSQRQSFVADLCYGYSENYLSIWKDYNKDSGIFNSKVIE